MVSEGTDAAYGARPLRRAIQRLIEDPLSDRVLRAEILPGDTVAIDGGDEGLTFTTTGKTAPDDPENSEEADASVDKL